MTDKAERAKEVLSRIDGYRRNIETYKELIAMDSERGYESTVTLCREIVREKQAKRNKLIKQVHRIENSDHESILELRYIDCYTWEEIADTIGYSLGHIYRLHEKALEEFYDLHMKKGEG